MAASTAVRQTALSLDAAFMEDAVPVVPVATTRRQTGRNLAALLIVSAIGSLALGSALAPSADAPSLRGHQLLTVAGRVSTLDTRNRRGYNSATSFSLLALRARNFSIFASESSIFEAPAEG